MATERVVIAAHDGYELVKYAPVGEVRIEHTASGTCSVWMGHADVDAVKAHPASMADWALDEEIGTNKSVVQIEIDRSGQGHCWERVDEPREAVIEALAGDDGKLRVGARANVGGMQYRVVEAR